MDFNRHDRLLLNYLEKIMTDGVERKSRAFGGLFKISFGLTSINKS